MNALHYSARLVTTNKKVGFSLQLTPEVLQQWVALLGEEEQNPPVKRVLPCPAGSIIPDNENDIMAAEWVKYSNWFNPSICVTCNGEALDDGGMIPQRNFDVGPIRAAMTGHVAALQMLLDAAKSDGKTPKPSWRTQCLQEAIRNQDAEMVRMLEREYGRPSKNQLSWLIHTVEQGLWLRAVYRELDLGAATGSAAVPGVRNRL